MNESSSLHGPREDDALKRETRSEVQANRDTRSEEWIDPAPPGEDQPDATWALAGRPGGAPPGLGQEGVEIRSDLARYLDHKAFPANRAGLNKTLERHNAPQRVIDIAAGLPGRQRFTNLHEVLVALGLPPETRQTG